MDKPQLLPKQTAHYFSVSSIDFEKCYKVMDLRIAKGLSDRDLSFLLGYYALFVRDVENPLHGKRYKAKDTNYLLHIFECKLPEIMDGKLPDLTYKLSVIATINANSTKTYEIYKEQHNGKNKLFRTFTELANSEAIPPKSISNPTKVKDFLIELLESGYFKESKTGLEIFRKCSEHFKSHIKPTFIDSAIKAINKSSELKLEISKNEMRRWVYKNVD